MPNSLRVKLKKLYYKGKLVTEEYDELIHKLDGHDREIRNKAIDDFVKMAYEELLYSEHLTEIDIDYIAEQLKAGVSDGNIQ